jgi:hypothetical protein
VRPLLGARTESKASSRLKQRFSDVRSASCIGFGYDWRIVKGREVFRAFYFDGRLRDRSDYAVTMYPTGRRSFKVYRY